jgi:hypothetical protein
MITSYCHMPFDKRCNEGERGAGELIEGANDRPGRRATEFKQGVHGVEVEVEPGADGDREGSLLPGVVVVANQGPLPQKGHQVA